jgi:hypothetical protein
MNDPAAVVVRRNFVQSITYSLGSVCFGSLLVAVVKTTRAVLVFLVDRMKFGKKTRCARLAESNPCYAYYSSAVRCSSTLQQLMLTILEYCLRVVEGSLEYFNKYAFCYVGIYGLDFKEASRAVVHMLQERGVTAIVNDEIVDIVLSLGHLVIAIVACGVATIYGYSHRLVKADRIILSSTGFLAGYLVCAVTLKVISSAVATTYVLFAEEPQEFEVVYAYAAYRYLLIICTCAAERES